MANPLAGISGGINAGGKKRGPQFPRGLDQHFAPSLAGVSGHVSAPGPHVAPSLGGISGHALAPGPSAPPIASMKGVSGAVPAGRNIPLPGNPRRGVNPFAGGPISLRGISGSARGEVLRPGPVGAMAPKGIKPAGGFSLQGLAEGLGKKAVGVEEKILKGQMKFGESAGQTHTGVEAAGPVGVFNPGTALKQIGRGIENAPSSLQHTITGAIPGAVKTAEAVGEAAKGHPGNLAKVGGALVEPFLHPGESFEKEPVPTALMLGGALGGAGRGAGALARSGRLGPAAAKAASMERAPLTIVPSQDQIAAGFHDLAGGHNPQAPGPIQALVVPRKYSPDLIHKGAQRAVEKLQEARGKDINMASGEQLNRHVYGGSVIAHHLAPPLAGLFKPGLIDKSAALHELLRRSYTRSAADFMKQNKPKVGAEAVPLFTEGTLRRADTIHEDLPKELNRLEDAHGDLHIKADQRLNEHNQDQIRKLMGDDKFMAPGGAREAELAAKNYADWSRPHEERLVELGILEPNQLGARNVPFAIAHRGYRYNMEPGEHPIVQEIKDLETARKAAQKRFQRAIGYREGRDFKTNVQPVSKAQRAVDEARNEVRDLGVKLKERQYDLQSMKDAGFIKGVSTGQKLPEGASREQVFAALSRGKPKGERYPFIEDPRTGREVPRDELEREIASEIGDRRLGFLTHKEVDYGQAMHTRLANAPAAERLMRTGESFTKGTYRRNYAALELQAYKNMNKIAGQESRNNILNRFGLGRFHGKEAAEAAARKFEEMKEGIRLKPAGELKAVPLGSAKVLSRGHINPRPLGPMVEDHLPATERALYEAADGPTHTLMPEKWLERLNKHDSLNNASPGKRLAQWYTNKWRSAALYTSPRWMIGNPQEHAIRMAANSINPFALLGAGKSVRLGKDMLDHWATVAADPTKDESTRLMARANMASWQTGTHYGSIAANAVRRNLPDVMGEGEAKDLAQAFEEQTPVATTLKTWGKWKGGVGKMMDTIEKNAKAAAIGKAALNDTRKFSAEWRALIGREDVAVKKWADGKLNPNEAAKLGEDINEMLGNWSTLTPLVRGAVQTWSPFGLWWLNSMKFIFKTLPRDHPMKTAALAGMIAGTGATKEAEGGLVPSYLEGGLGLDLPILGHVTTTPGYYSPAGIANEPTTTAGSMIAPQATSAYDIFTGKEPLGGEKIKGAQYPELVEHSLQEALTGITPGARQALAIAMQGGKPDYTTMNPIGIKEGTARQQGALKEFLKQVSPLRIALPPRSEEGGGGGSRPIRERPTRERSVRERPIRERPAR